MRVKADGGGLRFNKGKLRYDLIPIEWEEAITILLTDSLIKYPERNWERGMSWSTMFACARRHLNAFRKGERYDPESGIHHLAHAAWNVLALMSYDVRGIGSKDFPLHEMLELKKGSKCREPKVVRAKPRASKSKPQPKRRRQSSISRRVRRIRRSKS